MKSLFARGWPFVLALVTAACTPASPSSRTPDGGIENLRAEHPRLHFTKADQERIEKLARTDQVLRTIIRNVMQQADGMIGEPVVEAPGLQSSRGVLAKVTALSLATRLSKEEAAVQRYRDRAVRELRAAASLPDWNPRHFLDVAEMTTAFAIGYDWLYPVLSPDERRMVREAIVQKGLQPGLEAYAKDAVWVERRVSNWNQVCNGGLVLGALAVADEEPELATEILDRAKASITHGMEPYRQDGAYPEGPMYWWYGTTYNVLLIDALQTALGTDWGLTASEGFDNTAAFRIHAVSPNHLMFNYGDSREEATLAPALFWLARQYGRDEWADFHRTMLVGAIQQQLSRQFTRITAYNVAWYVPPQGGRPAEMPLDALFRGKGDVVMMRSAWDDPDALYAAFQGVWNQAPHGQLDHGSFVLDADGVRWARDLGGDRYSLPDYWDYREGGTRWMYYRSSNLSHNTLVVGGQLQRADAVARIVSFGAEPERAHAVMDLSESYAGQADEAFRGIAMLDRSRVLVQDELQLPSDTTSVRWAMVTEATVQLDGSTAVLTKGGRTLRAEILAPDGARFELRSTDPGDERQQNNEGTSMLATTVRPGADRSLRLAVLLTPVGPKWPEKTSPDIVPLDAW